ncbi:hypothetical protein ACPSL1_13270 [Vibrio parahaemolyticus]|nr:hypothetical protein [Vibrio parahaemolyticus]MCZ6375640.1 hypothetical protein [Vibrio parahaemolyticus]MDF4661371.1 hypothetical protein [Vibrio parahaemolyticus]MDG3388743.1 hypothetical protein [Vibrio parahaemolyticus]
MSDARTLLQLTQSSPYLYLVDIANLLSFTAIGYLLGMTTG